MDQDDFKHEVIISYDHFLQVESEWDQLTHLYNSPIFLTWNWLNYWWKVFHKPRMNMLIIILRKGDSIIAIAPFYQDNKELRFIGTGEEEFEEVSPEYLDLICNAEYADIFSEKIAEILSEMHNDWRCLVVNNVLDNSILIKNTVPLLKRRRHIVFINFRGIKFEIVLPNSWDDYIKSVKSRFRTKIRTRLRKMTTQDGYTIKTLSDMDAATAWSYLKELHDKRWKFKNQRGALESENFRSFHLQVIKWLLDTKGLVELNIVFFHDSPVTAIYNFGSNGTLHFYQSGFDPKYAKKFAPAHSVILLSIKNAIETKNITNFDLMIGSRNSYKKDYTENTTNAFNIIIYNNTLMSVLSSLKPILKGILRAIKNISKQD
ncbi:MAG: hypothetical protein COA78_36670 [Blastopirellula sp.]|nr:MAG: hypothetical protein COA78_36670 [Blastopirellula sp.]